MCLIILYFDVGLSGGDQVFASMSSLATFCNVLVCTRFGNHVPRSVSLDWVTNSGLRTRASRLFGPLTLPCDAGSISMCLHDVVTASPPCDWILRLEWLHLVRNSALQPVVYLRSGSLALQTIGSMSVQSSLIGAWFHLSRLPCNYLVTLKPPYLSHRCSEQTSVLNC